MTRGRLTHASLENSTRKTHRHTQNVYKLSYYYYYYYYVLDDVTVACPEMMRSLHPP